MARAGGAIISLVWISSLQSCLSISRGAAQEVVVSCEVDATVEVASITAAVTRHAPAILSVPRSQFPKTLRITPRDGQAVFVMELVPFAGADFAWYDHILLLGDAAFIVPILCDAALDRTWGWPKYVRVVFPRNGGVPYLGDLWRR